MACPPPLLRLIDEVLSDAVCAVRAGAHLPTGWKERIDRDYEERKR